MLDTTLFILAPVAVAVAMTWTFKRSIWAFLALTASLIAIALVFSGWYPDIVTLRNPEVGAIHGINTWAFPYAPAMTAVIVAAALAMGFRGSVATVSGAVAFLLVASQGCWIA